MHSNRKGSSLSANRNIIIIYQSTPRGTPPNSIWNKYRVWKIGCSVHKTCIIIIIILFFKDKLTYATYDKIIYLKWVKTEQTLLLTTGTYIRFCAIARLSYALSAAIDHKIEAKVMCMRHYRSTSLPKKTQLIRF